MSAIDTLRTALFGNPPSATWKPSAQGVYDAVQEVIAEYTGNKTALQAATGATLVGTTNGLLQAVLNSLQTQITTIGTLPSLIYATRALLYANTTAAVNVRAEVILDPTTGLNGYYESTGTGTGAARWTYRGLGAIGDVIATVNAMNLVVSRITSGTGEDFENYDTEGWKTFVSDGTWKFGPLTWYVSTANAFEVCDHEGWMFDRVPFTGRGALAEPSDDTGSTISQITRGWTGCPTENSIVVACDVEGDGIGNVVFKVATDPFMTNIVAETSVIMPDKTLRSSEGYYNSVVKLISGLSPVTKHYVQGYCDGLPSGYQMSFKTAPVKGTPTAFKFAAFSCTDIDASTYVASIEDMARRAEAGNLDFVICLGDMIYSNVGVDNITVQRATNTRLWRNNPSVQKLLKVCPIFYMPDDHDFSTNDCDWDTVYSGGATFANIGKNTRRVIRETTPIDPRMMMQRAAGETDPDRTILTLQWSYGDQEFFLMDTRSQRRKSVGTPTCLGRTSGHEYWNQYQAIVNAMIAAGTAGRNRIWLCSPTGWTGAVYDGWQDGYGAEQTALCNAIRDTVVGSPVTLIDGDFHASAIADGQSNDPSTGGGLWMAEIMSSPAFRTPLTGGGPYTWLGVDTEINDKYTAFAHITSAANGDWSTDIVAEPYTGSPPVGTVAQTHALAEKTAVVQFVSASSTGTAGANTTQQISRDWMGRAPASVTWTDSRGPTGTLVLRPNARNTPMIFVRPTPGGASATITLSNPVNCTLGANTVHTLNAT